MSESPARVLLLHNLYQQPGGEDQVFTVEGDLLEAQGHEVIRYTKHNDQLTNMGRVSSARVSLWNGTVYKELRDLIRRERPEVAHFHNTFPLISPAAYYAARSENVPVVQTLHNYRLLCPNALFFRDGRVCEDCLGRTVPWPGVLHACYRGSRPTSGVVATMLTSHRAIGTWRDAVDVYIALTEFARQKFVSGGLPAQRVLTKPNFVLSDPGMGEGRGGYFLFVGRLSEEKGLVTLLEAWEQLGPKARLKIVGEGPLEPEVTRAAARSGGIEWLGRQSKDQVAELMKEAQCLIFPSVWYEGFPMVIAEAYAAGLPVIASDLGGMSALIDHGRTGLHFRPGDSASLVAGVKWALAHPAERAQMRREAREEFNSKYSAEQNYRLLSGIYEKAIHGRNSTPR